VVTGPPDAIERNRLRVRPVAVILTLAGCGLAGASLGWLPWYVVSGGASLDAPIDPTKPIVLVDNHNSSHHSWLVWTLFAILVVCALAADLPRAPVAPACRIFAPVLAGLLVLIAVVRVATVDAARHIDPSLSSIDIALRYGFWVAIAGYLLLGVGAALGPRSGDVASS
jgi:hypothetical protein